MGKINYSISIIHNLSESTDRKEKELRIMPVLSIEEESGKWYFKDCLGNRSPTTKKTIHAFVFGAERIKVFGSVYFYPVYYPQHKPPTRELEVLKNKLV